MDEQKERALFWLCFLVLAECINCMAQSNEQQQHTTPPIESIPPSPLLFAVVRPRRRRRWRPTRPTRPSAGPRPRLTSPAPLEKLVVWFTRLRTPLNHYHHHRRHSPPELALYLPPSIHPPGLRKAHAQQVQTNLSPHFALRALAVCT